MPLLPTVGSEGIMLPGRLTVHCLSVHCPLSLILHEAISLCLLAGSQRNFTQIFIIRVGTAEKVFKVRGQRSRSYMNDCVNAAMAEAYIDGVASRLTCSLYMYIALHCKGLSYLYTEHYLALQVCWRPRQSCCQWTLQSELATSCGETHSD